MRNEGLILGGESSGHIVMLEHNTTGDALITALHVLATMIRDDEPLSVLAAPYKPVPEAHQTVSLSDATKRPGDEQLEAVRREAEAELDGNGRVVIRVSGTEPVIRVMVEHDAIRTAEHLAQQVAAKIGAL